jgi:PAS domain S-box-containing protein
VDNWLPTSRQRAERALRASETRYRRLFESAKDGILIIEADSGQIIDVNPFLAELLGYARDEFLGRHLWDLGPFKDIVASKDAFDLLQAQEYIAYEDLPLETSDGRHIAVGFVSNVYLVDAKRIIQCNIRDITSRKLAEQTRLNLEAQLRASQKMEAVGGLAGGIAHDFNNLLSVILCYTKFALDELPAESAMRNDLLEVDKATRCAATLTRKLLAFSRKQVLLPVLLDLNEVTESIETMLLRILGEDIELKNDLASDLGMMLADRSQLEQVIMNLVVNARDAMPGGGKLVIKTQNQLLDADHAALEVGMDPGPYVMFAVTDNGSGMDAATVSRVFEPFFTTKAPGQGTGLGLSTVYGIVKQSGGNIWVYSEPGRGTTVKIYLPRSTSGHVATTESVAASVPSDLTGTETILVVEDNDAVRNLAARILGAAGYTVLTAADGQQALQICASRPSDLPLVVSDVVMPVLGGRLFAARVLELCPSTRILFMSGYSDDAIANHGGLLPGTRFLEKPFNALDLSRRVREILDEGRVEPATRAAPSGGT